MSATHFNQVKQLLDTGNYKRIIDLYLDSNLETSDPNVLRIVGIAFFIAGEYNRTVAIYNDIASIFTDNSSFISVYGAALRRNGDLSESLNKFESFYSTHNTLVDCGLANNYANALFDAGDYSKALSVLQPFDSETSFNILDIKDNIRRIEQRITQSAIHVSGDNSASECSSSQTHSWDPLADAFNISQVIPINSFTRSLPSSTHFDKPQVTSSDPLPTVSPSVGNDELIQLVRSSINSDPLAALRLCNFYYSTIKPLHLVYQLAGDAYIVLKRFEHAEKCFMSYLVLGGDSLEVYINLCSLSSLTENHFLARHYYDIIMRRSIPDYLSSTINSLYSNLSNHDDNVTNIDPFDIAAPSTAIDPSSNALERIG